ncbi:MAG: DUF2513 domain-containing protein [Planctomycetota bacterium]
MKRDLELVKRILETVEAANPEQRADLTPLRVEYGDDIVSRHIELMHEAGLVHGVFMRSEGSLVNNRTKINKILWPGHDYLAATREPRVWNRLKQHAETATFQAMIEAGRELTRRLLLGEL